MQRFLEYLASHPLLVGGTALLALAVLAYEVYQARNSGQAVGPMDAVRLLNQGAVMVDVRSREQFDAGHVIEARNVPLAEVGQSVETLKRFKDKAVLVCCESGMTSSGGAKLLRAQGFTKVVNLRGGLQAWRAENLPLVKTDKDRKGK
jgi:rhodanese-related sulfurtransferase